jgi:hypothetical protein
VTAHYEVEDEDDGGVEIVVGSLAPSREELLRGSRTAFLLNPAFHARRAEGVVNE